MAPRTTRSKTGRLVLFILVALALTQVAYAKTCAEYGYPKGGCANLLNTKCIDGNPYDCDAINTWNWCWVRSDTCGSTEYCSDTLTAGAKCYACNSPCSNGQKTCSGNGYKTCIADTGDRSKCYKWSAVTSCASGQYCSGGSCVSCNNECSSGQKRCSGSGYQECTTNSNGCRVWGSTQSCGSGKTCTGSGSCVVQCDHKCSSGERRCSGNGVQACTTDSDNCRIWGSTANCAGDEKCSSGSCIKKCLPSNCRWDPATTLDEGATATLKADFVGCGGKNVDVTILESDWLLEADQTPFAFSWSVGGDGTQSRTWTTQWTDDTDGADIIPEYYFRIDTIDGSCASGTDPISTLWLRKVCPDPCAEGAKACDGSGTKMCKKDRYGCTYWEKQADCASDQKCQDGSCVQKSCQELGHHDWCVALSNTICANNNPYECRMTSALQWCYEKTDTCDSNEVCEDPFGTTGAHCKLECTNECTAGQTRCSADGKGFQTCRMDWNDCWKWSTDVSSCSETQKCDGGRCKAKTCQEMGHLDWCLALGNTKCGSNDPYECKAITETTWCYVKTRTCGADETCIDPMSPTVGAHCEKLPDCRITSMAWDKQTATAGEDVGITIRTEGCIGKTAQLEIYEDDSVWGYNRWPFRPEKMGGRSIIISSNEQRETWKTVYTEDQHTQPEYAANMSVATVTGKTGLLTVLPPEGLDSVAALINDMRDGSGKKVAILLPSTISSESPGVAYLKSRVATFGHSVETRTISDFNCDDRGQLEGYDLVMVGSSESNTAIKCVDLDAAQWGMSAAFNPWSSQGNWAIIAYATPSDQDTLIALGHMIRDGADPRFKMTDYVVGCVYDGDLNDRFVPEMACNLIPVVELFPDARDTISCKDGGWSEHRFFCSLVYLGTTVDVVGLIGGFGLADGATIDPAISALKVGIKELKLPVEIDEAASKFIKANKMLSIDGIMAFKKAGLMFEEGKILKISPEGAKLFAEVVAKGPDAAKKTFSFMSDDKVIAILAKESDAGKKAVVSGASWFFKGSEKVSYEVAIGPGMDAAEEYMSVMKLFDGGKMANAIEEGITEYAVKGDVIEKFVFSRRIPAGPGEHVMGYYHSATRTITLAYENPGVSWMTSKEYAEYLTTSVAKHELGHADFLDSIERYPDFWRQFKYTSDYVDGNGFEELWVLARNQVGIDGEKIVAWERKFLDNQEYDGLMQMAIDSKNVAGLAGIRARAMIAGSPSAIKRMDSYIKMTYPAAKADEVIEAVDKLAVKMKDGVVKMASSPTIRYGSAEMHDILIGIESMTEKVKTIKLVSGGPTNMFLKFGAISIPVGFATVISIDMTEADGGLDDVALTAINEAGEALEGRISCDGMSSGAVCEITIDGAGTCECTMKNGSIDGGCAITSCKEEQKPPGPDPDCICSADYSLVCGIDNQTYNNACKAGCAGVKIAHEGECVSEPACTDQCSQGQKRCDGAGYQRCEVGKDGCYVWGATKSCGFGTSCGNGECVSADDTCVKLGYYGQCFMPGNMACKQGDPYECEVVSMFNWCWKKTDTCSPSERCTDPIGFEGAHCRPTCTGNCDTEGESVCEGNAAKTCKRATDGCLYWDNKICFEGVCKDGKCLGCTKECTLGDKRCSGNSIQKCVSTFVGCTRWADYDKCEADRRCRDGRCVPACEDECQTEGRRVCENSTVKTCKKGADGCLSWDIWTNCQYDEKCESGACIKTCKDECRPGQMRCAGGKGTQSCDTFSGGCWRWSQAAPCANGETCEDGRCIAKSCVDMGYGGFCFTPGNTQCRNGDPYNCRIVSTTRWCWERLDSCSADEICRDPFGSGGARCEKKVVILDDGSGDGNDPIDDPGGQDDAGTTIVDSSADETPKCYDKCSEGDRQCKGNDIVSCARAADGCLDWTTASSCGQGQGCRDATCLEKCKIWNGRPMCPAGERCDNNVCVPN